MTLSEVYLSFLFKIFKVEYAESIEIFKSFSEGFHDLYLKAKKTRKH